MPEGRLQKARRELPAGYQFGDAARFYFGFSDRQKRRGLVPTPKVDVNFNSLEELAYLGWRYDPNHQRWTRQ